MTTKRQRERIVFNEQFLLAVLRLRLRRELGVPESRASLQDGVVHLRFVDQNGSLWAVDSMAPHTWPEMVPWMDGVVGQVAAILGTQPLDVERSVKQTDPAASTR